MPLRIEIARNMEWLQDEKPQHSKIANPIAPVARRFCIEVTREDGTRIRAHVPLAHVPRRVARIIREYLAGFIERPQRPADLPLHVSRDGRGRAVHTPPQT